MQAYLKAYGLWEVTINPQEPEPLRQGATVNQIKHHEEELAKGFKALTAIHSCISDTIFTRIMACESAKEAWDKLQDEFQGSARTRQMQILNLRREFETIKMKDKETVKEFTTRLLNVVNQIRVLGERLSDQRIVEKVLVSLPERFEAKISSLEESRNLNEISLTELVNALQATEQRRRIRHEESMEAAFVSKQHQKTQNQKKNKLKVIKEKGETSKPERKSYEPCHHCKKKGHHPRRCWWRPDAFCHKCQQKGHVERVCKANKKDKQQANVAKDNASDSESEELFVATCFSSIKNDEGWIIDSGATHHMSHKHEWFTNLDRSSHNKVKIGNGALMEVKGKGDVVIHTTKGIKTIHDVLYVPSLCENLLSVGQMLENKYALHFSNMTCTIVDPHGNELMCVGMKNKNFRLNMDENGASVALNTKVENTSQLWHKRLGHASFKSLVGTHELVRDMPLVEKQEHVCEVCQKGKHTRLAFQSCSWRSKEKLGLIHSDICGPMSVPSLNGSKYFITFIDDYSRMCWVYFLERKSQALEKFVEFMKLVQNQSGCTIKVLRTDNGGEYTSEAFKQLCKDHVIVHQFTTPYTPQQNGVCERKNRTIMEMARCLLFESGLPKKFWAEGVNTSIYIQNRLYSKSLRSKTPFELWFGYKPSLDHLRVFGSICYILVPQEKRGKLDERSQVGVLVGYSDVTKGYRVYNLETKKLVISRDVKVDEEAKWVCSKEELASMDEDNRLEAHDNDEEQGNGEGAAHDDEYDENELEISIGADLEIGDGVRGTRPLNEIYERCNVALSDPINVHEAMARKEWRQAMQDEIDVINKNDTWSLVTKPKGKNAIGVKWIFRTKYNPDGSINKHKARLVVKGYAQQAGVDYGETFAPVARMETIRLLLAISAQKSWKVYHLDVKSAFLNGILKEEVYVVQPEGFVKKGSEEKVYKLHKALYGLKQAPRAWYAKIDGFLTKHGFRRSPNEPTLYIRTHGCMVLVSLYVDDLLVTGGNEKEVSNFKSELELNFEMSSLGEMKYFLGIEVVQSSKGIFISQESYVKELLKKFDMEDCNSVATPMNEGTKLVKDDDSPKVNPSIYRSLIGSLLYVCSTRPDIMFSVAVLSRFMHSPSQNHLSCAKRILRYLKGTSDFGIWYKDGMNEALLGYSDSDWAGSLDDSKSTSGYIYTLGNGPFSWNSKKQQTVAQSTAEAEYIACSSCANQGVWLRKLLEDLSLKQEEAMVILCDNTSAIAIAQNPVQHGRTKHIPVKYHSLREFEASGEVKLEYVTSEENLADIFTKPLGKKRFEILRGLLNVSYKIAKEEC